LSDTGETLKAWMSWRNLKGRARLFPGLGEGNWKKSDHIKHEISQKQQLIGRGGVKTEGTDPSEPLRGGPSGVRPSIRPKLAVRRTEKSGRQPFSLHEEKGWKIKEPKESLYRHLRRLNHSTQKKKGVRKNIKTRGYLARHVGAPYARTRRCSPDYPDLRKTWRRQPPWSRVRACPGRHVHMAARMNHTHHLKPAR